MLKTLTLAVLLACMGLQAHAKDNAFTRLCDTFTRPAGCDSSSGCDATGGSCNQSAWYVQTEAAFLAPITNNANQAFVLNDVIAAATVTPFASTLDGDQFVLTPRLTIGRTFANGWGIQARYWDLNTNDGDGYTGPFFPPAAVPDLNLVGGSESVDAYTIDLEATKCLNIRGRNLLGTFGVRHGALEQSTSQVAFGQSVLGDSYVLSALSQNSFHGTGVTYGLSGTRDLCNKKWSLYAGGRLSHLFGTNQSGVSTSAVLSSPFGGSFSTNGAIASGDDTLFIAESNAGIQWAHCLKNCRARCFARLGVEYQYWNADDGVAVANSIAGVTGSSNTAVSASAVDIETHFVGLNVSTGFSW